MWSCPVCNTRQTEENICTLCGYDPSCDYARYPTLGPALPRSVEPADILAEKWQRKQMAGLVPNPAACPKCGKLLFWVSADRREIYCASCGTALGGAVSGDVEAENGRLKQELVRLLEQVEKLKSENGCRQPTPGVLPGNPGALPFHSRPIAAGSDFAAKIRNDGHVAVLGTSWFRNKVSKWENVVSLAAFGSELIGVQSNGRVLASDASELQGIERWTDICEISAAANHVVGLRRDGTVVAVGKSDYGACRVEHWRDIIAVAAAESYTLGLRKGAAGPYTLGLRKDGTVAFMGFLPGLQENSIASWKGIKAIAAGSHHILGLRENGTVIAAGKNFQGRCYVETWRNITAIAAGRWHSVGLRGDGTVVAVGGNENGRCNVSHWRDVIAIDAEPGYTLGLQTDGNLLVAGTASWLK